MSMVRQAELHGPLRKNSANPRYFTDNTGKAIFLAGFHTWAVMQDMWLENEPRRSMDYDGFLQMMEDNGHNFLRFWQWDQTASAAWSKARTIFAPQPYERTGPGEAADRQPKFDLTRWNEAYFKRLRERIRAAGRKGIYASVMLFEAWCIKWATSAENDPWLYHPMRRQNNVNGISDDPVIANGRALNFYSLKCPQLLHWQKELVKKIIDAVNGLDNVLYEICNEIPYTRDAMEWQDYMCDFIHDYEGSKPVQHPVGITAEGGDQDNGELFATHADWISPSNGRLYEYRYNPPVANGEKVVVNDTDHLWGHGCETAWIWKSFLRGMNVLFMDPWERIPGELDWWQDGSVSRNQRYYYEWDPVRRNLGYARQYGLRMELNNCTPMNDLCTSTYCLANPSVEYLFFLPAGGTEGIDLWNSRGSFETEWFNPVTGGRTMGAALSGRTRHAVRAPFEGAAVLYLYRKKEQE